MRLPVNRASEGRLRHAFWRVLVLYATTSQKIRCSCVLKPDVTYLLLLLSCFGNPEHEDNVACWGLQRFAGCKCTCHCRLPGRAL